MADTPDVITRYLRAAEAKDFDALTACFTDDGTVLDEGHTYRGRDEIRGWRESTASKYTYTLTVTGTEPLDGDRFRVSTHLVGDFPGGEADLAHDYTLRDGLISHLAIG